MLRGLSIRRHRRGYEQLGEEEEDGVKKKLSRANSSPATSSTNKLQPFNSPKRTTASAAPKKASKIHPFFSLFETKKRNKATTRPDFSRYLEYVKEGGAWDVAENRPVMYYK